MNSSNLEQYDHLLTSADWLKERSQAVAITITEILEPIGGKEAVIFPPTFAFSDKDVGNRGAHPYPISSLLKTSDGVQTESLSAEAAQQKGIKANYCDLDTVGSQANRMEPIFLKAPLNRLVPQIEFVAKTSRANLLEIGHRIADGAARFSGSFGEAATNAIVEIKDNGNAEALARLAPTSLVFGFWDSRGTYFKAPRILSSVVRATNVAVLRRSAQYGPPFDIEELLSMGDLGAVPGGTKKGEEKGSEQEKNPLSKQGLLDAPATDTHGGVRVFGEIVRRTEINLVHLRSLQVTSGDSIDEASLKMRRYLLALSLVAAQSQAGYNLRQGCLLVTVEKDGAESQLVFPTGEREPLLIRFEDSLAFAEAAARDFNMYVERPTPTEYQFQAEKVVAAIKADELAQAEKAERAAANKAAKDADKKAKAEAKSARETARAEAKALKNEKKNKKANASNDDPA